MNYIRQAQIGLLNRNDDDRAYRLNEFVWSRVDGVAQELRFQSVGQRVRMPAIGQNVQPYYEQVSPVFTAEDNNMFAMPVNQYDGTYCGPTVYFAWRDYIDKTHPFRYEHQLTQAVDSKQDTAQGDVQSGDMD